MKYVSQIQRDITKRLFEVMYHLIEKNKVKNKKAFAEAIHYPYYPFLRLEKNENTAISLDALYFSCVVFGINPVYLLTGTGEHFIKGRFSGSNNTSNMKVLKD